MGTWTLRVSKKREQTQRGLVGRRRELVARPSQSRLPKGSSRARHLGDFGGLIGLSFVSHMGVSKNRGSQYSTLNSRILIIRTPKKGIPIFGTPNIKP